MATVASDFSDYVDRDRDQDRDADREGARTAPLRAAPVTRSMAALPSATQHETQATTIRVRHVRLARPARRAWVEAWRLERRLVTQHAPRWYERLARWLLTLPLRAPVRQARAWWDTAAVRAALTTDRAAALTLRGALWRDRTRITRLARRILNPAHAGGWVADGDLWRLQVHELLDAAGLRVEVETDGWGARHYQTRVAGDHEASTHPTLDAVLDGGLARPSDASTWPAVPSVSALSPTARAAARFNQPAQPPVPAFRASFYRPLRALDVTPPPLPRIHTAHDWTDTPDPWD